MTFKFHSEAEQEFNDAIDYYESVGPNVGYNFFIVPTLRRGNAAGDAPASRNLRLAKLVGYI